MDLESDHYRLGAGLCDRIAVVENVGDLVLFSEREGAVDVLNGLPLRTCVLCAALPIPTDLGRARNVVDLCRQGVSYLDVDRKIVAPVLDLDRVVERCGEADRVALLGAGAEALLSAV